MTFTGTESGTTYSATAPLTITLLTPTLTLSASPASPQPKGTKVTLTVNIANAFGMSDQTYLNAVPVTFKDGTTILGTAIISAATGSASYEITSLADGAHSYTAEFPGEISYNSSTVSNAVSYATSAPAVPSFDDTPSNTVVIVDGKNY